MSTPLASVSGARKHSEATAFPFRPSSFRFSIDVALGPESQQPGCWGLGGGCAVVGGWGEGLDGGGEKSPGWVRGWGGALRRTGGLVLVSPPCGTGASGRAKGKAGWPPVAGSGSAPPLLAHPSARTFGAPAGPSCFRPAPAVGRRT